MPPAVALTINLNVILAEIATEMEVEVGAAVPS